jgi:hypothetical protein
MSDLYFLVSRSPPGAEEGPYVLCRIKTATNPASNPLVAFADAHLGNQLMVGLGIGSECQILPFGALQPSVAAEAKSQRSLFFDSPELVARYLEQGPAFEFATYTMSFDDAYAHTQRAV